MLCTNLTRFAVVVRAIAATALAVSVVVSIIISVPTMTVINSTSEVHDSAMLVIIETTTAGIDFATPIATISGEATPKLLTPHVKGRSMHVDNLSRQYDIL